MFLSLVGQTCRQCETSILIRNRQYVIILYRRTSSTTGRLLCLVDAHFPWERAIFFYFNIKHKLGSNTMTCSLCTAFHSNKRCVKKSVDWAQPCNYDTEDAYFSHSRRIPAYRVDLT